MSAPTRPSPASLIKHAADVASFYGFRPAREFERARAYNFSVVSSICTARLEEKHEPVLAWWASPTPAHVPLGTDAREVGEFGLHIAGTHEPVGEIVLLKTLSAIVGEWGAPVRALRLNALGDRDSKARYARELTFYFRKHLDQLCETCKDELSRNPLAPFTCSREECRALSANAPRAMNFLSEKSRAHFREVLEHIEGLGLPYELDDGLVHDERESQILFALDVNDDATIHTAWGGRFDDHVRKTTSRKDATGLSASIFFRKKGLSAGSFQASQGRRIPKVFFVQLGLQAKLRGLNVIDELRHAQVPILQSFDAMKLGPQLEAAKASGVSHLIIMGAREALDGTVIVREVNNSAQTIVELGALPRFLKTLK